MLNLSGCCMNFNATYFNLDAIIENHQETEQEIITVNGNIYKTQERDLGYAIIIHENNDSKNC